MKNNDIKDDEEEDGGTKDPRNQNISHRDANQIEKR